MAASQQDITVTVRETALQVLCALSISLRGSELYAQSVAVEEAAELLNDKWKLHESIDYVMRSLEIVK